MARKLDEGTVERMKKSLQERFGDPIITIDGNQTDGTNTPCRECGGMMTEDGGSSMHEDMLGQKCRECRKGTYKESDIDADKVACSWCGATTDHYRFIEPEDQK